MLAPYLITTEYLLEALFFEEDKEEVEFIVNELWNRLLPIAERYCRSKKFRRMEASALEDLLQEAYMELRACILRFDPSKNVSFENFFRNRFSKKVIDLTATSRSPLTIPVGATFLSGRKNASPDAKRTEAARLEAAKTVNKPAWPIELILGVVADPVSVEDEIIERDLQLQVDKAINSKLLTDMEREVMLTYLQVGSFAKVSEIVRLPSGRCRLYYQSATAKLKAHINRGA